MKGKILKPYHIMQSTLLTNRYKFADVIEGDIELPGSVDKMPFHSFKCLSTRMT